MANIKWIKITTDVFDDEKIKLIDSMPDNDALLVIWFKLLVLAGKVNDNGFVYVSKKMPVTDEMLATIFNRPLNTVRLALNIFSEFDMIEIEDHISIINWEKHQNVEGMEKLKEQNRLRQRKYKEKQRQLLQIEEKSNVKVTLDNATDKNREDKNREDKIKEKYKKKTTKFVPPTIQEIKEYCLEKNINVDADQFFNYFEAGDWVDSKGNKVKSWKQKLLTWNKYSTPAKKEFTGYTQEGHKVEDYSKIIDF